VAAGTEAATAATSVATVAALVEAVRIAPREEVTERRRTAERFQRNITRLLRKV